MLYSLQNVHFQQGDVNMTFRFKPPVDPENPLDKNDLPPEGWQLVDTRDYAKALHGFPPQLFTECVEWEKREFERIAQQETVSASVNNSL